MTRIERTSLVDLIVRRLEGDLLSGRYTPGMALPPERELSSRLGVTRTSLKHALVRLEQLGWIRTTHGVGSIVQNVEESGGADLLERLFDASAGLADDLGLLEEVLEARSLVVGAFARLAAARRSARDLRDLSAVVDGLSRRSDDPAAVQSREYEFMRALARASANRAFVFLTNSISAPYRIHREAFTVAFRDGGQVEADLRGILEAVRDRDGELARTRAERYLDGNARRVLASIRTKKVRRKRKR